MEETHKKKHDNPDNVISMARMPGRNYTLNGALTRDAFKTYFCSEVGRVPWQDQKVDQTN